MKISKNTIGVFHYTLKDSKGKVIDSSVKRRPVSYIHGMKNIIPGLEKVLKGKAAGDAFKAVIPSKEGYGAVNKKLISKVPLENFSQKKFVRPGARFKISTPEGIQLATVKKVEKETVTVDFNHSLAGKTLRFDLEVVDVRPASEKDLALGHVHVPGSNCCGEI